MERIYREQLNVQDVDFIPVVEQMGVKYRGMEGAEVADVRELTDPMIGLQVSTMIPEGFYAEPMAEEDAPAEEETTEESLWIGGSVTLANDIQVTDVISIENGVKTEVNLNSKTITAGVFTESNGTISEGNTDSYAFWVKDGGELVIDGEGSVIAQDAKYSMAVWAQGGTVTINGGDFYNGGDGCDLIYASAGGKVYIYGGEFHATGRSGEVGGTKNKFSALNIKDKDRGICEIIVYGGTFYGFNPANNVSEGENTNFVAEGYHSVEISEGVWQVMAV